MDHKQLLVNLAVQLKVPEDQIRGFLGRGYIPLPWQLRFHAAAREADSPDGPTEIGVGGARGPGKSHAVFSQVALDDCLRIANLKALFLRQTGKAARESLEDLILRAIAGKAKYEYNSSTGMLKFANGSRVLLGGFENEKDIDKYIGIEYDLIAIEEENQLTEEKVTKLKGSLRTSKANWRPRLYTSFNPGGIGHLYIKQTFIDPYRTNTETRTRFVPSTYKDNPYLNREYIEYLEGLKGSLGKAWREGNWDTFEGQYFAEWNFEKHVAKPFTLPQPWKKYRSYDHGRTAPACCKWYALDYDGRVWVYRELYVAGLNVDQIADHIQRLSGAVQDPITKKWTGGESYEYSVADPSIFSRSGMVDAYGGQTIAESFARQGITFIPGSNRRVDGWNLVHKYLFWDANTEPLLKHFDTCYNSIRTYPVQIHDELHPEDLDTDGEDHAIDPDRYLIMSLHEGKTTKPKTEAEQKLDQMKRQSSSSPRNFNKFYNP